MAKPFTAQMNFDGRVALVTGGASGIGFAVARQLAELGASIAIADINIEGAEAAAARLTGAEVMATRVDVCDPADAMRMVDAVVAHFGKLDILVHSAGVGIEKSFLETTAKEWRRLIDIDLSGTFYCAQAAARHMVETTMDALLISPPPPVFAAAPGALLMAPPRGDRSLPFTLPTTLPSRSTTPC